MNPVLYILFGFLLGSGTGVAIGWLLGGRSRPGGNTAADAGLGDARLEQELRKQLAQRDADLAQARQDLAAADQARTSLDVRCATAETALAEERRQHERQLDQLRAATEKSLADVRETFKALSADALKQTQPEFLRLANESLAKFHETAKGDLAQRQQSIATLLEPLKQQLETYQLRLQQSESGQSAALGEVTKHLETLAQQSQVLSSETLQLRRILGSNQARGRWGEETLRRVVEASGMSAHCDFVEQAVSDDSKPDLVVHLPGDRLIVVDSKVPDLGFLNALDASTEASRSEALAGHASRLKAAIKSLADRDYPAQFTAALDHVVLFLPAESLFSAALEADPDMLIWAAERKILLATPASLIALLRAVAVSWQQHAQTQNAREIAEAARELYSRTARFMEHFERIREGLVRAGNAYNDAVGSYERMVRPSGERLARLGGAGAGGKTLPELEPVQATLRLPTET